MATDKKQVEIPGRLHSVATEGVVAGANEILDDNKGKNQQEINTSVDDSLQENKTDIANEVTRATNAENAIKGGSSKSIQNLDSRLSTVEAHDTISMKGGSVVVGTADDFTNRTTAGDAKIPTVGAILNGADEEPTANSNNMVKSGGVYNKLNNINKKLFGDFSKDVIWQNGYIDTTGLIKDSSRSKFSQPFLLKAGESVIVGTLNSNITIIGTTEQDSLNIGDSITQIQKTSTSSEFEEHIYTAVEDIKIVICVLAANYTLSFHDNENFMHVIRNIDEEPTAESENLVRSGGVFITKKIVEGYSPITVGGYIGNDGQTIINDSSLAYSEFIDIRDKVGKTLTFYAGTANKYIVFYDSNKRYVAHFGAGTASRNIEISDTYYFVRFSFNKDYNARILQSGTVIWDASYNEGLVETSLSKKRQELTPEQQAIVKENIGLPTAIDEYPTLFSKNLVFSDGVVKGIKDSIVQSLDTFGNNFFIGYKVGSNGAIIKDAQYCISEYIPVNTGSSIKVSIDSVASENMFFGVYSDTAFITIYALNAGGKIRNFVAPENATRLIITFPINANALVEIASEIVWESNSFSLVTKSDIANIESTTNNNNNRIKALEDNIHILGSSTIDITNKYINANNMVFNLSEPRRTFKFKLIVPDGTDMTNYSIYAVEPDGTRHMYFNFIPNTEAVFTDKGFDVSRVAIARTDPNIAYTGIFTFSVYEYYFVTIENFNDYKKGIGFDEREIIPDYYFANDYLQNKVAFIKNLLEKSSTNGDAFFFQTDEHWEVNAKHSPSLIKYLSENLGISRLFDGGDTTNNISINNGHITPKVSDFEILRRKTFKGSIYHAIGNHEYLTGTYSDINLYQDANFYNWVDFSYFNNIDANNIIYGDIDKHYYYVDNKQKKIRYIILSTFKQKTEPREISEGYYNRIAEADYDNAQLDWFTNTALNVEQGWTILIFTHYFCGVNRDGRDNDNGYFINTSPNVWTYAKPFARAMLNYSGNGEIAAIIEGHTHWDGIWHIDDALCDNTETTGKVIPCIASACDAYGFSGTEKLFNRTLGTITEQAFDVVVLDKTQKKLTFVRIGAPAYDLFTPDETGNYPLFGDLEYREVSYGN